MLPLWRRSVQLAARRGAGQLRRCMRALPANLLGALWMAGSAMLFAVEALFVRWMTERGIPTEVQVLARASGQLVWMAPLVIAAGGLTVFRTARPGLHLLRGLASVTTWGLYYLSFAFLDLATATVLSFLNVMFTTILAIPVLGERVGASRWAGTIAGFIGVAIMLRPGTELSLIGAAISIAAALTWCGITLTSRILTRTEGTATVVAWVGLVTTLAALPFGIAAWQPLSLADAAILLGFALFTPGIIWTLTEALRAGEASAVAPFQYLRLVVIALFGWMLFGEVPDGWTVAGAAAILTGAVIITIAEARRR
jgi:drug/metabolite transporter (DMT)-like permease